MKLFFFNVRLAGAILILCSMFLNSCEKRVEKNNIIKTEFANIADKITDRDFNGLWQFTDHEN